METHWAIIDSLKSLQRKLKFYRLAAGLLFLFTIEGILISLFILIDFLYQLPLAVCWIVWIIHWLGVIIGFVLVIRWSFLRPPLLSELAVQIEKHLGDSSNLLVNLIDFLFHPKIQDHFFASHLSPHWRFPIDTIQPYHFLPKKWISRSLFTIGIVAVLSIFFIFLHPDGVVQSIQRFFFPMLKIPPYSLTKILEIKPRNGTIVKGNSVKIEVKLGGKIPLDTFVELRIPKVTTQRLRMIQDPRQQAIFYISTPPLDQAIMYRVIAGDTTSPWYTISVDYLPELIQWEAIVHPPSYTQQTSYSIHSKQKKKLIIEGSEIELKGTASTPLTKVMFLNKGQIMAQNNVVPSSPHFTIRTKMETDTSYEFKMIAANTLERLIPIPWEILPDRVPEVRFLSEKTRYDISLDQSIPLEFIATDDIQIDRVELVQIGNGITKTLLVAPPPSNLRQFTGRFIFEPLTFGLKEGGLIRLCLHAYDTNPRSLNQPGRSGQIEIRLLSPREKQQTSQQLNGQHQTKLTTIIELQRENLQATRTYQQDYGTRKKVDADLLSQLIQRQTTIRNLSIDLLQQGETLPSHLLVIIQRLVQQEMLEAIRILEKLLYAKEQTFLSNIQSAINIQNRILSLLQTLLHQFPFEEAFQTRTNLLSSFQVILKQHLYTLEETTKVQQQGVLTQSEWQRLADLQGQVSTRLSLWIDQATEISKDLSNDFSQKVTQVLQILSQNKVYPQLLKIEQHLLNKNAIESIPLQRKIYEILLSCMQIFNEWRIQHAQQTLEKARDTLNQLYNSLEKLEKEQKQIAESTRDLLYRQVPIQEAKEILASMDKKQQTMKEEIEKLAQDLYQFPELPISNELLSKMREIYEDVQQAANSANEPAIEIAVQKEDALLDAIKNTKERIEDVEMWLPDKPDNVRWNMETFDVSEFPSIPLVPLPEELEDIVGELLQQAEAIDAAAQDPTGNNLFADAEMGWSVMDGPMPNFSAKGKSGNTRPNDNEMTGRSGSGREGQATGEMVESVAKGLEGRETHTRRTNDPFQKGTITEDPHSTLQTKSTGGGKLGGESESIGMFGNSPRRDLQHSPQNPLQKLRMESEALYAKNRMYYLGNPSSLAILANELRTMDRFSSNMQDLSISKRIIRRLSDAQTQLTTGVSLNLPTYLQQTSAGTIEFDDVNLQKVDPSYRNLILNYFNQLQ